MACLTVKSTVYGYSTIAVIIHCIALVMCLTSLVLAAVAYGPDDRWNHYIDHVLYNNRLEEYFEQSQFYITLDYEAYARHKDAYDEAHSPRILTGYIKTLKQGKKHVEFGSIFGAFHRLKGELLLGNRHVKLLELQKKEIYMQITTICILVVLLAASIADLVLCFVLASKKPVFKPLNGAFHAIGGLLILIAGVLYVLSALDIAAGEREVADTVSRIAVQMYKERGFMFPYRPPPPPASPAVPLPPYNTAHFMHSCGFFGLRTQGADPNRSAIPLRMCSKGIIKFTAMIIMGVGALAYFAGAGFTVYLGGALKRNRVTPLSHDSDQSVPEVQEPVPGGAPEKEEVPGLDLKRSKSIMDIEKTKTA